MQTQEERNECEYWRVETLNQVRKALGMDKLFDLGLGELARAGVVQFKFHDVSGSGYSYSHSLMGGNQNINMLMEVLFAVDYMAVKKRNGGYAQKIVLNWGKHNHDGLLGRLAVVTRVPVEIDDLDEAVELLGAGGGSW